MYIQQDNYLDEFAGSNDVGNNVNPILESLSIPIAGLIFTYVARSLLVDRAGCKPLLLGSNIFMALSAATLRLYFYLSARTDLDLSSVGWLPVSSVCVFLIAFSLGYCSIPWIFMSEIIPWKISFACSITCVFNWVCIFAATNTFSGISRAIGVYGAFWAYAAVSVVGAFYVCFLVPETKGKSVEEVQVILGGKG